MKYDEWERTVPDSIASEKFWQFLGYRKALFLHDLVWIDTNPWMRDARGRELAKQIVRSVGSISANIRRRIRAWIW